MPRIPGFQGDIVPIGTPAPPQTWHWQRTGEVSASFGFFGLVGLTGLAISFWRNYEQKQELVKVRKRKGDETTRRIVAEKYSKRPRDLENYVMHRMWVRDYNGCRNTIDFAQDHAGMQDKVAENWRLSIRIAESKYPPKKVTPSRARMVGDKVKNSIHKHISQPLGIDIPMGSKGSGGSSHGSKGSQSGRRRSYSRRFDDLQNIRQQASIQVSQSVQNITQIVQDPTPTVEEEQTGDLRRSSDPGAHNRPQFKEGDPKSPMARQQDLSFKRRQSRDPTSGQHPDLLSEEGSRRQSLQHERRASMQHERRPSQQHERRPSQQFEKDPFRPPESSPWQQLERYPSIDEIVPIDKHKDQRSELKGTKSIKEERESNSLREEKDPQSQREGQDQIVLDVVGHLPEDAQPEQQDDIFHTVHDYFEGEHQSPFARHRDHERQGKGTSRMRHIWRRFLGIDPSGR